MAFKIIWTKRAKEGYDKIIAYLEAEWSEKEIRSFVIHTDDFLRLLSGHPEILQRSSSHKSLYRGPINKLTILTYQVKRKEKQIILLNIRGARQKPLR